MDDSVGIETMFDLSGKTAVVVGGNSGIGKGIAEGLAEAGANIVVSARRLNLCQEVCAEIEKLGVKALPVKCDITKTDEVNNLIETTVKELGGLDILVYSAGIGEAEKLVVEMSDEDWDKTLNIMLRGAFLCSRAAAKEMIKQNSGKMILVASMFSIMGFPRGSAYCASKGGVAQLAKVLALELARYNIQVNTLSPGYVYTPINQEFFSIEENRQRLTRNIPQRRIANVNEIKGIAVYLASPASSYMTGANIIIDGGQSIW